MKANGRRNRVAAVVAGILMAVARAKAQESGDPAAQRIVVSIPDCKLALIENVQRADLNAIEEAEAFQHLSKEFGMSHEAIASRVGKSRVAITNTIRLLEAGAAVKQALVDGRISEGHARALLALGSSRAQEAVLQRVVNLDLSVRQTELLARKLSGHKPAQKRKQARNPDASDIERRLSASLGTRVALKHGKKGGSLTIHYYSNEELDAILEKLL
jgi:ParB family chromosome partitioning protein